MSERESIKEDKEDEEEPEQKISFLQAWMLPRVILYSSAFFCTKMAVYCLLLLLPSFLKTPDMDYSLAGIAHLSTTIDVGAIFGSMTLGYISDLMHGKRSPVAMGAVLISIAISYCVTFTVKDMPTAVFFILMFMLGFCISGLNNMISSACSADLGKQEALKGNSKAVSTVTGIIDGTGTLGSAAG
jgi:sugar phosphate permease